MTGALGYFERRGGPGRRAARPAGAPAAPGRPARARALPAPRERRAAAAAESAGCGSGTSCPARPVALLPQPTCTSTPASVLTHAKTFVHRTSGESTTAAASACISTTRPRAKAWSARRRLEAVDCRRTGRAPRTARRRVLVVLARRTCERASASSSRPTSPRRSWPRRWPPWRRRPTPTWSWSSPTTRPATGRRRWRRRNPASGSYVRGGQPRAGRRRATSRSREARASWSRSSTPTTCGRRTTSRAGRLSPGCRADRVRASSPATPARLRPGRLCRDATRAQLPDAPAATVTGMLHDNWSSSRR